MKKLMLIAALGVAGLMSASSDLPLQNSQLNDSINHFSKFEKESNYNVNDKVKRKLCVVFHATCTSAYTCFEADSFNDIRDEALEWAAGIQENYCMIDSPFSPD